MLLKEVLKLFRGDPAQGGVRSKGVVEGFNVSEDSGLSSTPGRKPLEIDHFILETAEEVFSNRVVIGIPFSEHALANAMPAKNLTVSQGSVLDASVAVEDEA